MKQKLIKFFWKELFITNYIFVKFLAIFFVFKFSLKILGNETKKIFYFTLKIIVQFRDITKHWEESECCEEFFYKKIGCIFDYLYAFFNYI